MEQYIEKAALVAEIERILHFNNSWIEGDKRWQKRTNSISSAYYKRIGSKHTCESFLDFINTLEVKEVDFDEEFRKYHIGMYNPFNSGAEIYEFAKHFFELGLKAKVE